MSGNDLETRILGLEDTPRGALRRLLTYVLLFSNSKKKKSKSVFSDFVNLETIKEVDMYVAHFWHNFPTKF